MRFWNNKLLANKNKISEIKNNWLNVTWDEVATFIGPNAPVFKPVWEKQHTSWTEKGVGSFGFSWCWPALIPLLGIPWAAARRLWPFVGMMVAVVVAINVMALLWPNSSSFGFIIFFAPAMAKPMYVQYAVAKVAQIKKQTSVGDARDAALMEAGGLRMKYGYVAGGVCAAFLALLVVGSV